MTLSSPRQLPRNLRMAASLFLAVTLGGMIPARAGLNIIAIAGDLSAPSPNIAGGGNITTIFEQAALNWELAYPDPGQEWTLEVTYHWDLLDPGLVAQFTNPILDGNGRIIAGTSTFNNLDTPGISWFADPTPEIFLNNPAFTLGPDTTNQEVDAGGHPVMLNTGIAFVAEEDSLAFGRSDLLTIAMHEVGHGLGLLTVPDVYETPLPLLVTEEVSAFYEGYDIYVERIEHMPPPSLMADKTPLGHRFLPAANDILAMAVIAGYENPVLNPLNIPDVAVPEVSSFLLCLGGLALVMRRRRRAHGCGKNEGGSGDHVLTRLCENGQNAEAVKKWPRSIWQPDALALDRCESSAPVIGYSVVSFRL